MILGQRHEGHEEVKHADIRVEENPRQKKHPIRPGSALYVQGIAKQPVWLTEGVK